MNFNKSSLAFEDIRSAFDRAMESPKGVRITCADRGSAVTLRARFNYLRKLNREENMKVYPTDHPLYGKSVYDRFLLRIGTKGTAEEKTLFIEPYGAEKLQIEEL